MPQRPFVRFLLSLDAIQVHLLCLTLIVVLSISLWTGDAQPDYAWGLLFTVIAYPSVLGLMWWSHRLDGQIEVQHAIESIAAPEKLRRKRLWWRRGSLAFLFSVAAALVYFGNRGLRIDFLPAQYIGYLLVIFATLGAVGVNIWYAGPLDTRNDPPPPDRDVPTEQPG